MRLILRNVEAGYNNRKVINNVSAIFKTGEITCLLGPNGSGKTTLFKTILGLIPSSGDIYLDTHFIKNMSRLDRAKLIAYVPQMHTPHFPYTVFDVVLMGRTPFVNSFSSPSPTDIQEALNALSLLHIHHLKDCIYSHLSGGERQMVLIARALAQSPRFLIMDEPTSHLDYGNQIRILKLISELAKKEIGIILTTHDPDHAFLCATNVLALTDGHLIAIGNPHEVLTGKVLKTMYGVDIDIIPLSKDRCVCTSAFGG